MDRRASRTPGRQNLSEKQMCVLGPRSAARGSSPQITRNSSRLELPQAVLRRQQGHRTRLWLECEPVEICRWCSTSAGRAQLFAMGNERSVSRDVLHRNFSGCVLQGEMGVLLLGRGRKSPRHRGRCRGGRDGLGGGWHAASPALQVTAKVTRVSVRWGAWHKSTHLSCSLSYCS